MVIGCQFRVVLVVLKHSSNVDEQEDAHSYLAQGPQHNAHNVDEEGGSRAVTGLAVEPSSMQDFHLCRGRDVGVARQGNGRWVLGRGVSVWV